MTDQLMSSVAAAVSSLPVAWLRDRRWFSSKGRDVASLDLIDWGALPIDQPGITAIVRVRYTAGRDEQYFLPLIVMPQQQIEGVRPPPALSIAHDGATWFAHDAFQFPAFHRLLMERLVTGGTLALNGGTIEFTPESSLQESPPPLREIRLVTAEQSNSSIIYDRQAILKVFRRVVAGLNPDVEVSRFLSHAGFQNTPAMLGSISYVAGGVEHSLGLAQGFEPNHGDAWDATLERLRVFFAAVPDQDDLPNDPIDARVRLLAADQLDDLRGLGALTGAMHLALASDRSDPAFAPRPLTEAQIAIWQRAIREQAETILPDLASRAANLAPHLRDAITRVVEATPQIRQRIESLSELSRADIVLTRFHGDYHLGQILASDRGYLILDFEGEPLRSLEERRAHSSPLKDVAGMVRSLSYAASAALFAAQEAEQKRGVQDYALEWENQARRAYLDGYFETTEGAPFIPADRHLLDTALAVFELEKALYELNYELNNRPDWLPIPLRGILHALS